MPLDKLRQMLDAHGVKYVTIRHSPAYTAQEIAAAAHVKGREMAKTVVVKLDGDEVVMVVLPASLRLDLYLLLEAFAADRVELAGEEEFARLFPGCEVGAMPPFGNLFGLDVYVARELVGNPEIAFNAGSHRELIRLAYRDFARLVMPVVIDVCAVPAPPEAVAAVSEAMLASAVAE